MSETRTMLTIFGLVAIAGIIVLAVSIQALGTFLTYAIIGVICLAVVIVLAVGIRKWQHAGLALRAHELDAQRLAHEQELAERQHQLEQDRFWLERERHHQQLLMEQERHAQQLLIDGQRWQLEQHLAMTRIPADQAGHYPYMVTPEGSGYQFLPNAHLLQLQSPRATTATATNGQGNDQVRPSQAPSQAWLLAQLPEGGYTVSPGVQASTGKIVQVNITEVPHLKILGSTGFGKSCLAAAILDQATQLNGPELLQLALLDLEHKTSRLFEDLPHIAEVRVGKRLVPMVATNADEVAEHLGYLKVELDRRTKLSEAELDRIPILLMYVEEMLSLQYEVVDPKLLARMFADLTILSVRGRKYGMFLLCCMQTDYSSEEMKVTQKMFRFRAAAAVDASAARAAGFMNTDLIKQNFAQGQPGQFVIEYPSFSNIVLAPVYDVKRLVRQKADVQERFTTASDEHFTPSLQLVKPVRNIVEADVKTDETALKAKVRELREKNWGKVAIIEKVWGAKAGATDAYKKASAEYDQIIAELTREALAEDEEA